MRGERATDRDGPGDICRVQGITLDTRVHQQQIPGRNGPIIGNPVQNAGVGPAGHDRVITNRVAFKAGPRVEGSLHDALASGVPY